MQQILDFIRVRATQQSTWVGLISLVAISLRISLDPSIVTQMADAVLLMIGAGAVLKNG